MGSMRFDSTDFHGLPRGGPSSPCSRTSIGRHWATHDAACSRGQSSIRMLGAVQLEGVHCHTQCAAHAYAHGQLSIFMLVGSLHAPTWHVAGRLIARQGVLRNTTAPSHGYDFDQRRRIDQCFCFLFQVFTIGCVNCDSVSAAPTSFSTGLPSNRS